MGLLSNEELFGEATNDAVKKAGGNPYAEAAARDIAAATGSQYGALDIVPELGKGLARGFLNLGAGVVGTADFLAETLAYGVYAGLDPEKQAKVDRFNQFIFDERKRRIVLARKSLPADPENAAAWAGAMVGEAIPYMAASMAGAAAVGGAAGAMGATAAGAKAASMAGAASVGFAVEGEMAYQNAIDKGATKGQANLERLVVGGINAAIETMQVGGIMDVGKKTASLRLLKNAAQKKMFGKVAQQGGALTADLIYTAIGEGLEEGAQEFTSMMVPAVLRNDVERKEDGSVDWKAYLSGIGGAALGGAVVGGIFGGAKIIAGAETSGEPRNFNDIGLDDAADVVRSKRAPVTLTKEEEAYAERLETDYDMPLADARAMIAATAERRMTAPLSKKEMAQAVTLQMGDTNIEAMASNNVKAIEDVLHWAYNQGGVPKSQDMRNDFMTDMRTATRLREKQIKKGQKMELMGKDHKKLGGWNAFQTIRYALGNLSVASGHNLGRTWSVMNGKANEGKAQAQARMQQVFDEVGVRPIDMNLNHEDNHHIARYLFEGDETDLDALSPEKQKLATELNKVLQDDGRRLVTKIRWKLWNQYGIDPDSVDSKQKAKILEEGRKAEADGTIDEWLGTQTWGAKEQYYMSAGRDGVADKVLETLEPEDISKMKKTRKPGTTPAAARSRKKRMQEWKKGSVLNNIQNHLSRLNVSLQVMDDASVFWKQLKDGTDSNGDLMTMKKFVDNMLGRRVENEIVADVLKKSTSHFWRFHFLNPAKAAYFFTRNILQNAYMGSQMSMIEIGKAGKDLVVQMSSRKHDPQRVGDFVDHYKNEVSQKQQMLEQALMIESERSVGGKSKSVLNKALYYADKWGSWAVKSDSINRTAAWNLYYTGAKNVVSKYQAGEYTWKQVQSKLKLDTLHYSQRIELMNMIEDPEFFQMYAGYKTENTHFRYETTLRSSAEQSTMSRAITGLLVYPRGVANLVLTNGFVPMMQGMKSGNYRQAYSGLKSVLSLAVGVAAARWALEEVTGRESYTIIPEYRPLGPGLAIITENIDRINNIRYRYGEDQLTANEAVQEIMMVAADHTEIVIPLIDVMVDAAESVGDKSGMRFSRSVKAALKSEYPDYNYQDRSFWEKIAHVIWGGGFEEVEE